MPQTPSLQHWQDHALCHGFECSHVGDLVGLIRWEVVHTVTLMALVSTAVVSTALASPIKVAWNSIRGGLQIDESQSITEYMESDRILYQIAITHPHGEQLTLKSLHSRLDSHLSPPAIWWKEKYNSGMDPHLQMT